VKKGGEEVNMEEKNDKIMDSSLEEEISVAEGAAQEILEEIEKKGYIRAKPVWQLQLSL